MNKPVLEQTDPKKARGAENKSAKEYPKSKDVLEGQNNPLNPDPDTAIPYGG